MPAALPPDIDRAGWASATTQDTADVPSGAPDLPSTNQLPQDYKQVSSDFTKLRYRPVALARYRWYDSTANMVTTAQRIQNIPPRPAADEPSLDARERILRTAYELFRRYSTNTVGVDRIVAEAGVADVELAATHEEVAVAGVGNGSGNLSIRATPASEPA